MKKVDCFHNGSQRAGLAEVGEIEFRPPGYLKVNL
jgi:hypothetical protein